MARKKRSASTLRPPVRVFISYSNRDRDLLDQLLQHLAPMVREGLIDLKYDLALEAGTDWSTELPRLLSDASVALFLVSPSSLSSQYIAGEVELAISQQETKRIIPVVLRPCDWFASPLAKYLALPTGARPVTTWEKRDEAFVDIARALRRVIESVRQGARDGDIPAKHSGTVNQIAVAPDGHLAVSAGDDGLAIVWDGETLQSVRVLTGHSAPVTGVQVSPDGRLVVTCSRDRTIKLWDLGSGTHIRTFEGHTQAVSAVEFTEDGRRLVSGSQDSTLRSWDLESGNLLLALRTGDPVIGLVLVPGTGRAVSMQGAELAVWELVTGMKIRSLSLTTRGLGLSAIASGKTVITLDLEGFAVWDIDSGGVVFRSADALYNAVRAAPDGRHAIVARRDGLQLWDLTSGTLIRRWSHDIATPTALAVTWDGTRAFWGSSDGGVFAWPVDLSVARALPVGGDRLRLAYLAVLESPELWRILETWDESALAGIGAQLGIPQDQDVLEALTQRRPNTSPPALWAAWMETLYRSKLGRLSDAS